MGEPDGLVDGREAEHTERGTWVRRQPDCALVRLRMIAYLNPTISAVERVSMPIR